MQKQNQRLNPRLLLLTLGMFVLGTDGIVIVGVLPQIAYTMGVTEAAAGQLITFFAIAYGLGAPFLAALASRWPSNRVLITALAAFSLANLGSAFAPTYSVLFMTRILAGCFAALCSPLFFTLASSLVPAEMRGKALSLVTIGGTVAIMAGGPLGAWIGEHWGWRMSLGGVAAVAGIACMALLIAGLPRTSVSQPLSLRARLTPLRKPNVLFSFLPVFFAGLGFHVIYTFIAQVLQSNLHTNEISGLLIACGLGSGLGSWIGGVAADRYGIYRSFLVNLLILLVMESLFPFTTLSWAGALFTLMIWGGGLPSLLILQQHRLLDLEPGNANVLMGLNSAVIYLGMAGGAGLGGLTVQAVSASKIGWIGALFTGVALVLFLAGRRVTAKA